MSQSSTRRPAHTNRLVHETSPYLLQHAHNPVDWYPWGPEAFERAKREDKPVLLSVGYAACHWCHVMEHESFENEEIARLMNEHFVCIKVDREERPDVDTIYMNAVQMMTGHGGWPMTVFLTPDQEPFYAGTYFPPEDRHGMPGFPRILSAVADAYRNRRDDVEDNAREVLKRLKSLNEFTASDEELSTQLLDQAARGLRQNFDPVNGGFGRQPKFPPAMTLAFLLRQYHRTRDTALLSVVELTLEKMAQGGIYDQLGGGFHRYSVDERWLVPHFEKMLYDNALLSRVYVEAWLATSKELYQRIAVETLDYVRREMTDAEGGFYSTQDADSEGEEGKFFVWTPHEVKALLGEADAQLFNRYFDVSEAGNFEGHSILHVDTELSAVAKLMNVTPERLSEVIERGRRVLFKAREQRVKPARDEKILTAWNGLMLRSFAEAARAFERDDYRDLAVKNAEFLLSHLRRDGRLLRSYKDGEAKLNGYLDDYAFLIDGLLALYHATFDVRWFEEARSLADTMIELFWDKVAGGFFFTSADHEALISRTKDPYDNATPSGNSVAVDVLLRLALFTGESRYQKLAVQTMKLMSAVIPRAPSAFSHLLCAIDFHLSSPHEVAIVGAPDAIDTQSLVTEVFNHYLPNKVVAAAAPDDARTRQAIKLLEGRTQLDGRATAYVCHNYYCEAPVTEVEKLAAQLT